MPLRPYWLSSEWTFVRESQERHGGQWVHVFLRFHRGTQEAVDPRKANNEMTICQVAFDSCSRCTSRVSCSRSAASSNRFTDQSPCHFQA
jgi:hypothetical protein